MKLNQSNSALRVCVDSATDGQLSGRVLGERLENPLIFKDISNLLLQIDDLLNVQDYPRAFQHKRSFGAEEKATAPPPAELVGNFMSKKMVEDSSGEIATLTVQVVTRQNTTWQGNIVWLDGRLPSQEFRSALEFVRIVHNTLIKP